MAKLVDIAKGITRHLERMEADPQLNRRSDGSGSKYFNAHAWRGGRFVFVRYTSYQLAHNLSKAEAEHYLHWLDAGNNGKHIEAGARP